MPIPDKQKRYWRTNLAVVLILLSLWFLFSCVLSIFLVEPLNRVQLGGFPLGFWIAQQGSIFVFVLLILAYVLIMRRVDRKFDLHEEDR